MAMRSSNKGGRRNSDTGTTATVSTSASTLEVDEEFFQALKENLEVKDRTWRTKTYKQCFLHSQAVDFVMRFQNCSEESAVRALNELRLAGYLQHVVDAHKPFKMNQKGKLYFCFLDDESSHIKHQQKINTEKFLKQNKITSQILKEVVQGSDDFVALESRLHRLETLLERVNETGSLTESKLEILHQATISLIETTVVNAMILLVICVYTLYVILPSLHQSRLVQLGTSLLGTLLVAVFLLKSMDLFSIWLQLDISVVQAVEGSSDEYDDDEDSSITTATAAIPTKSASAIAGIPQGRRALMHRKQSSVFVREGLLSKSRSQFITKDSEAVQQRLPSDLPPPSEWPHRPVLVCNNTPADPSMQIPDYANGPCPIGKPFRFSSDLFEGQCLIRLRNIPTSDAPDQDEAYFSGRRRLFQTIVQGRFKQALPVSQVLTGHEFVKPLNNLPHPWILKAATNLIGKLAPGAEIRVLGNQPTMLASLAATSQVIRADAPGNEPDIASVEDLQEDCTSLGGKFSQTKLGSTGRKLHLSNPKRASKYTFDTETVYTFDFYQSLLNCATYTLDLGVANIRMTPVLNGQPIQALCKTTDGRYLWSFQIWHEDLLPPRPISNIAASEKQTKKETKTATATTTITSKAKANYGSTARN